LGATALVSPGRGRLVDPDGDDRQRHPGDRDGLDHAPGGSSIRLGLVPYGRGALDDGARPGVARGRGLAPRPAGQAPSTGTARGSQPSASWSLIEMVLEPKPMTPRGRALLGIGTLMIGFVAATALEATTFTPRPLLKKPLASLPSRLGEWVG